MAVCLVTGGAGFIGSHLAEALVDRGETVRILDNFSTGSPTNLASVQDRVELAVGDVTNPSDVHEAMKDVETVFHHAALSPSSFQGVDPLLVHHVVATGTLHLLQAACLAGVR